MEVFIDDPFFHLTGRQYCRTVRRHTSQSAMGRDLSHNGPFGVVRQISGNGREPRYRLFMPSEKKEAMLRTWEMLKLIPLREPGKTARVLLTELAARGYSVSKKTVERDLVNLSIIFPITCNEDSKPYQWFWTPDASLNLPGVALTEALSLVLAEETLMGLMHKSLLAPLKGRLDAAKRLLSEAKCHNSKAGWADKICAVPRDLMLRAPMVNAAVLEAVQDALPSAQQIAACHWMTEKDLEVYSTEYARTGFQGGLNSYRILTNPSSFDELKAFAGRTIDVPALFIGGASEWGPRQSPGALEAMQNGACTRLLGVHLVDKAGHSIPEEQPEQVNRLLIEFLHRAGTAPSRI